MADERFLIPYPAMERHRLELAEAGRRRRTRILVGGSTVLAVCLAAWMLHPYLAFMLAGVGAMILFFASLGGASSVPADQLLGEEGELRVLRFLRQLPDQYLLLNQLRIKDPSLPNGERELDFLVIGPGGLHLIEVKNTAGRIVVQPEAKSWPVARRAGCGSSACWNSLASPLRQVQAQAAALEQWLLTHGLVLPVRPVVCFARPEVQIEGAGDAPHPVVVPEQLLALISSQPTLSAGGLEKREHVAGLLRQRPGAPAAVLQSIPQSQSSW
ncbi:MAG: NERD domain-containing protein [Wenzhouxiangella sp.]|nr:NERD domain-containing protein [Wenzhouxiangella sp.]